MTGELKPHTKHSRVFTFILQHGFEKFLWDHYIKIIFRSRESWKH